MARSEESIIINHANSHAMTLISFKIIASFRLKMVLIWTFLTLTILVVLGSSSLAAGPDTTSAVPVLPSRLVIPSIDLDSDVASVGLVSVDGYYSWEVPANVAGWHADSALPGNEGNVVLSGHHNIKGKVFRDLKKARVGDGLTLYVGDQAFDYEITRRMILREALQPRKVRLANARWVEDFGDERLTLVTCHPSWTNTHRLIVVAKPVPDKTPKPWLQTIQ